MSATDAKAQLQQKRAAFRARLEEARAEGVWGEFEGRIAAVLSGGGARGAYEAGVLLAFQDAKLPTHIITATSVGSINAASYAAHSDSLVGNAEHLTESWFDLTPPAVGIEWTRYAWMLAGLIAASAGFGNLISHLLDIRGFRLSLHDPVLTWVSLGLTGVAVLLLYDRLPYLGYIVRNFFRGTSWKPDRRKAAQSVLANLVVWGFLLVMLRSLEAHVLLADFVRVQPGAAAGLALALVALVGLRAVLRAPVSMLLHRLIRLPLRTGLFANFERGRYLRQRISNQRLRASPIRVVFTATDLEAGTARFFSNVPPQVLAADPGVDARFVAEEVVTTDDLMRAVIASTALPIAYEPLPVEGRAYVDGGIVANQPIRPAIRLGAEVLFLVMMDPPEGRRGEARTFVDVGLRALDILMLQNLLTDLKILTNVNAACERAAASLGLRPEEIEMDMGTRRYRYVKAFTIRPPASLGGTVLDFGGETTGPAILQGYRDACAQIENFLAYAPQARFGRARRLVSFSLGGGSSRSG